MRNRRFLMKLNEHDIQRYCKNKPQVTLTIATHEKGDDDIRSFGCNGVALKTEGRSYEVGSVSKVILATLLAKCLEEGLLNLNDTVDRYIDLPSEYSYPSILQLATHTSGYKDPALFESKLDALSWSIASTRKLANPFDSFGSEWLVDSIIKDACKPRKKEGRFLYSNFGYSVLGYTLSRIVGSTYQDYITAYIREELGLSSTSCYSEKLPMIHGFKKGHDLGNWTWSDDSAYAPAGCICSNAADLLSFAKMNLYDEKSFVKYSHRKQASDRFVDIGLGWMIEKKDDIIWHNGRTGMFHTFLAFSKKRERAVVLLSNCISSLSWSEDGIALSIIRS